ncbi:MAG TPA: DHH family phosphoesterase [Anaerolineales bacterium]|nr:DHH family phosphoesterase [Anaerolineales bacterium]HMV97376.1 DHH family phosphoesterase [Anaerolineales bacterium]HMX18040.1 DHH family phosphoesterase [Anaerolineales bacterium]HMX73425.1 DHH family phosphoesterase [Anaerolineales bacterium]HMZ42067.1 DHH family phosphoesterase [Anaerolineales bacterium]
MPDQIYVIGHVNPDTDSIAAAMGYAWLLRERDGANTIAARAGALNAQTSWVLKTVGLETPVLLTDASPRFESVMRRLDTIRPDSQLGMAWTLASKTGGVAPVVNEDGKPFGIINGMSLFKYFSETLGPRPGDTTVREMMAAQCKDAADTSVPKYAANAHIRDALNKILRDEFNDYWVVDEHGVYVGIANQREVLNPPRLKIILVDHNEPRQAIAALEEAELLEILDHHRLGNPYTHQPIRFTVDTVGSTSTLVAEMTAEAGLSMPPALAGTLLAGLCSDTLILTSPTTTQRDKVAADRLSRWAFVGGSPLKGETIESYGKAVLSAGAGLSNRDPKDVVSTDIKPFEGGGFKFAVAQAEVTDILQLTEHLEPLQNALNDLRDKRGLHFAMLLVTDVVRGTSRLLISANAPTILEDLPYPPLSDGTRDAQGVVSRKKQLLPAVLGLLER